MIEGASAYPKLTVQELKGLNERFRLSNPDITEFDILRNAIPINAGSLSKMLGCKRYSTFSPSGVSPILGIFQTFDSSHNIIVQCRDAVYVMSENDLFGIVDPTPVLVPYTPPVFGQIVVITATNPAAIQTGLAHGLTTGNWVIISGVVGGTFSVAINAKFQVTVVDATHFTVTSNCTVIPTDLSASIFTVSIAPAYDGDDELYPEAMFYALVPNYSATGAYGGSGSFPFVFDRGYPFGADRQLTQGYQINPDGTTASFASIDSSGALKCLPGKYRFTAIFRGSGNASRAINAQLSFSSSIISSGGTILSYFTSEVKQVTVTNENVTILTEALQSSDNAFFVTLSGAIANVTSGTAIDNYLGKAITGMPVLGTVLRIVKIS